MIVKNEAKIITRCLDSISDYLDYWVICDTGSTDGTQDVIKKYFADKDIDGELHKHKWKNFGHNRTLAIQHCYKTADYVILLDADFVVNVLDKNFKNKLSDQTLGYLIQYVGGLDYRQMLLVSGHIKWKYVGVTHEYIHSDKKYGRAHFDLFNITHECTGSNRSEKFPRDIKLLKEGLKEEPKNSRYMFYLAQSYKDSGDNKNAIIWYTKRVKCGGWPEEVYYSLYSIGLCKERAKYDFDNDVVYAYLKAFHYRRHRLEALYQILFHYRTTEKYKLGFGYGMLAYNTKYPKDILFVKRDIHLYKFIDELAICAYYVGCCQLSIDLINKIITEKHCPAHFYKRLNDNINFGKKKLGTKKDVSKSITTGSVPLKLTDCVCLFSYDINNKGGSGRSMQSLYNRIKCGNKIITNDYKKVLEKRPSIIISQQFATKKAIELKKKLGCKLIACAHGPGQIGRCNPDNTNLCVFNSEHLMNMEKKNISSQILYPLVSEKDYKCDSKILKNSDKKYITLLSRNDSSKGGDMFIALASLFPDENFLCVGYNPITAKPPFKNYKSPPLISKKHNSINITQNIKFVEFVSDPRIVYKDTKLIIFPSVIESYGRIVIEASMNNIPCLCSDLPGIREASYNLFEYCNPRNIDEFEDKLKKMLQNYDQYVEKSTIVYKKYKEDTDRQISSINNFISCDDGTFHSIYFCSHPPITG